MDSVISSHYKEDTLPSKQPWRRQMTGGLLQVEEQLKRKEAIRCGDDSDWRSGSITPLDSDLTLLE